MAELESFAQQGIAFEELRDFGVLQRDAEVDAEFRELAQVHVVNDVLALLEGRTLAQECLLFAIEIKDLA